MNMFKCDNPKCGFEFTSPGIKIQTVADVTFTGIASKCPKCGGEAGIKQGRYKFDENGIITFFKSMSDDELNQLRKLLKKSDNPSASSDQFIKEVARINPKYVDFFKEALKYAYTNKDFRAWVSIILGILLGGEIVNNLAIKQNTINIGTTTNINQNTIIEKPKEKFVNPKRLQNKQNKKPKKHP